MSSSLFLKFLLAGGLGATCYIICSTLLTFFGLDPWESSVITYTSLVPIIYSIQKKFVFKSNISHGKSFPRYLTIQFIGIIFSVGIPFLLDKFAIEPVISFVCVIFITSLVNYTLQLNWAFRATKSNFGE